MTMRGPDSLRRTGSTRTAACPGQQRLPDSLIASEAVPRPNGRRILPPRRNSGNPPL